MVSRGGALCSRDCPCTQTLNTEDWMRALAGHICACRHTRSPGELTAVCRSPVVRTPGTHTWELLCSALYTFSSPGFNLCSSTRVNCSHELNSFPELSPSTKSRKLRVVLETSNTPNKQETFFPQSV